jgi:hypothetical protein
MDSKYSCERCGKGFAQKSHYTAHTKRKTPCENNGNKIKNIITQEVAKALRAVQLPDTHLPDTQLPDTHLPDTHLPDITTFKDLYEFLQTYPKDALRDWLEIAWVGKDKQESLLRLFANLGLIGKISNFIMCKGNFNLKTIQQQETKKDAFYDDKHNQINLKDKGDSSDLTGMHANNSKHLLVTTSKNLNKLSAGDLHIDKILTNFEQYKTHGYTMQLAICVRSIREFEIMKANIEHTSKELKKFIDDKSTILIDWDDLIEAFHKFKMAFETVHIDTIINSNKSTLNLKMHQRMSVDKTLRMKRENKERILWGHIQRSGKSYIIGGCIIEDSKDKETCNYLVITTAPNETIDQILNVFKCIQLEAFTVVHLTGENKQPVLSNKNIIVCSKQFLQSKLDTKENVKCITWLKKMIFEMRFLDESHNGGTTELAQNTLINYGNKSFTVQITATYSKPINDYNISRDSWILWDLEDIKLCKNISNEQSIVRLVEKHGDEIKGAIAQFSQQNIIDEYSKYPDLEILTWEINENIKQQLIERNQNSEQGWSLDGVFLGNWDLKTLNPDEKMTFQKKSAVMDVFNHIFGEYDQFGITDNKYPVKNVFMEQIKNICLEKNSRHIDDFCEPMVIMCFLPQSNIYNISLCTKALLENEHLLFHPQNGEYIVVNINSKENGNAKERIEAARIQAKNTNKKGVLVLSGKQCSLGVSIDNCDIVILLNNNMAFDMIYQMMFRSMTEGANKKCGFVIDLNIHRVINKILIEYSSIIKPNSHPKEGIKFILKERLLSLNSNHWKHTFGFNEEIKLEELTNKIYDIYSSNAENALKHFIDRLCFKKILLCKEDQKIFNALFSSITPTKKQREIIDKIMKDDDTNIKKGVERSSIESEESESEESEAEEEEEEETKINYMDILKHIIPLICLLTIHNVETSFIEMFNLIESDSNIYTILIDQTKSWWGKSIDSAIIKRFINLYIKYMKDDVETAQIIRTVKELFVKNINNSNELSSLIDKYFVPHELEKNCNAEVSTHYKLRQEMLSNLHIDFWKTPQKVLEPCCGKGGFVVDMIGKFMEGLKEYKPDAKERYKFIVEECVYWCDINPTNIFICKLLVDPYNQYALNYSQGDTLKLDIKEKWNLARFNATIGNPPYNEDPNNSNDPHMKPLYQKWIYKFTELSDKLLFITPSKWFTSQDPELVELREYMKTCKVKFITHYPEDNVFKNVKIKGGVSYYLIDKYYSGKTLLNDIEIDMNDYDIITEPKFCELINHLEHNKFFVKNLSELYTSQGKFITNKLEKELTNDKENTTCCFVSQNKGFKKYIDTEKITAKYDYWKVITTAAAYKGTSGFSNMFIGTDAQIHSRSYISFKVNDKNEADSLYSYLKCKISHILLSSRKITHNLCNGSIFKWIPLVPLDRIWTNEALHAHFNLSESQIDLIRNTKLDGTFTPF